MVLKKDLEGQKWLPSRCTGARSHVLPIARCLVIYRAKRERKVCEKLAHFCWFGQSEKDKS